MLNNYKGVFVLLFSFFAVTIYTNKVLGQIKFNKVSNTIKETGDKVNTVMANLFKVDKNKPLKSSSPIQPIPETNEIKNLIDLNGRWTGKCEQNITKDWDFDLYLVVTDNKINGKAELSNSGGTVRFIISGQITNNSVIIYEDEVSEEIGWHIWCKKDYHGVISQENNKIFIKGEYDNTNFLQFRDKKVEKGQVGCNSGSFLVSKVDEGEEAEKLRKIEEKSKNNVYTKDKDENDFIKRFVTFFGDNYDINWHSRVNRNSLICTVLERDKNGFFTKVQGKFLKQTKDGTTVSNDTTIIIVYFDMGLPFRISYPSAKLMPDQSASIAGDLGRLQFTESQLERINLLNAIADGKENEVFEKNRIVSLNALIAMQNKIYSNVHCSSCISRSQHSEEVTTIIQDQDLNGVPFERKKTSYDRVVEIKNLSNKKIIIVGIKKMFDVKKGIYYADNSMIFEANESRKFNKDGVGGFLGIFADVDLDNINEIYNNKVNNVGETQYLKIVYAK